MILGIGVHYFRFYPGYIFFFYQQPDAHKQHETAAQNVDNDLIF